MVSHNQFVLYSVAVLLFALSVLTVQEVTATALPPLEGKIVFFRGDPEFESQIYIMNADGTGQTNISNDPDAFDEGPSLSPDGTKVAFARWTATSNNYEIYVMNADGTGQTNISNSPEDDYYPNWSPDGTKIVFTRNTGGEGFFEEVWVMDAADGGSQENLSGVEFDGSRPAYSPDGLQIAFSSTRDEGVWDIFVMDAIGDDPVNISNDPGSFDSDAAWSPDGEQIAFTKQPIGGNFDVYVMNPDGTEPTNLSEDDAWDSLPAWSPDGSRIAFHSNRDGAFQIFVMNADGTGQTNISSNDENDSDPSWAPGEVSYHVILSDEASCEDAPIEGDWFSGETINECTVDHDLTIGEEGFDGLTISSGITLTIESPEATITTITNSGEIFNFGTINNNDGSTIDNLVGGVLDNNFGSTINNNVGATLENSGTFSSVGDIFNDGTINNNDGAFFDNINADTLVNTGIINNNEGATLTNDGTIQNDADGSINNFGTITNNDLITNSGTITNQFEIDNFDEIINNESGDIVNTATGSIVNEFGGEGNDGTITNSGTFTNSGDIENNEEATLINFATFDNNDGGTIDNDKATLINFATINNNDGGYIDNNEGATIDNNEGATINNNEGGTIINEGGTINNFGTINNECGAVYSGDPPNGNAVNFIPCDTPHATILTLDPIRDVTATTGFTVSGTLTDGETGEPIPGQLITFTGSGVTPSLQDVSTAGVVFTGTVDIDSCPTPATCATDEVGTDPNTSDNMVLHLGVGGKITFPEGTITATLYIQDMGTTSFTYIVEEGNDVFQPPSQSAGSESDVPALKIKSGFSQVGTDFVPNGIKEITITEVGGSPSTGSVGIAAILTGNPDGLPGELHKINFEEFEFGGEPEFPAGEQDSPFTINAGHYFSVGFAQNTEAISLEVTAHFGGSDLYLPSDSPTEDYNVIFNTAGQSGEEGSQPTGAALGGSITTAACSTDTDSDGICDIWEQTGLVPFGTPVTNYPISGSASNQKDIWVEIDCMVQSGGVGNYCPSTADLNAVKTAFLRENIDLHIFLSDTNIPFTNTFHIWTADGDTILTNDFDNIKKDKFGTAAERSNPTGSLRTGKDLLEAKAQFYHYGLFVKNVNTGTSTACGTSGQAELGGNDFIVSLGCGFTGAKGSPQEIQGTLMHELGHNLGLRHGGGDDDNCKPNLISVMTYSRQMPWAQLSATPIGTAPNKVAGWVLTYSRQDLIDLNEVSLTESSGLPITTTQWTGTLPTGSNAFKLIWGKPPTILTGKTGAPVNWDLGSATTGYSQDLNKITGLLGCAPGTTVNSLLRSYDEFAIMDLKFRDGPNLDGTILEIYPDPHTVSELSFEVFEGVQPSSPLFCGEPQSAYNVIDGNNNDNNLVGTSGNDLIRGFGGKDIINGKGGIDCLLGGDGNDTINGEAGDDELIGGTGIDKLNGGDGKDELVGGSGNDQINGGPQLDRANGGTGTDSCINTETEVSCES